jgi:hypothetical protein
MGFLWFDESIRDNGKFIVGALVYCDTNLSPLIQKEWKSMGLNPTKFEFKSSTPKAGDKTAIEARDRLHSIIRHAKVGFVICPTTERQALGAYAVALVKQIIQKNAVPDEHHFLFLDQGIVLSAEDKNEAEKCGVEIFLSQDSRTIAGIQLADLASHSLGGMLLEKMGLISKTVRAGEESGYDPETEIEIGFELWASLRYLLIQSPQPIRPLIGDDVQGYPVFQVQGYGLFLAPSCSEDLREHATARFGENYLGCIH